jgi:hypothetical protein
MELAELHGQLYAMEKRDKSSQDMKAKVEELEERNEQTARERVAYEKKVVELLEVISQYEAEVEHYRQQIIDDAQLHAEISSLRLDLQINSNATRSHENCCHVALLNSERENTSVLQSRIVELTEQLQDVADSHSKEKEIHTSEVRVLQGRLTAAEQEHKKEILLLKEELAREYSVMQQRAIDLATSAMNVDYEARMQALMTMKDQAIAIAERKYDEKVSQVEILSKEYDAAKLEFSRELDRREHQMKDLADKNLEFESLLVEITQKCDAQKTVILEEQHKLIGKERMACRSQLSDQKDAFEAKLKRQQKKIHQMGLEMSENAQRYVREDMHLIFSQLFLCFNS